MRADLMKRIIQPETPGQLRRSADRRAAP
uniref:Uncharacterized protein n=1 Tax=Anguilla anguilla TaxID=7936 RepID=A0A0E9UE35_ANGAN